MFRCDQCHKSVGSKVCPVRPVVVVVETRPVEYFPRSKVNRLVRERKQFTTDDPGGKGQEIKKEMKLCPDCNERREVWKEPIE